MHSLCTWTQGAGFNVLKFVKRLAQNGCVAGYCWVHWPLSCLKKLGPWLYFHYMPSFLAAAGSKRPFGITARVEKKACIRDMRTAPLNLMATSALGVPWSWSGPPTVELPLSCAPSPWLLQPAELERFCSLCFCAVILSRWTEAWERLPNEVVMMAKATWTWGVLAGRSTSQTVSCFWPWYFRHCQVFVTR